MLPRIVRVSALRSNLVAARLPMIQRRGFLPPKYAVEKDDLEKRYPDPPSLTEAEDPEMVSGAVNGKARLTCVERRLHQSPSNQAPVPRPLRRVVGSPGAPQLWRADPRG